MAEVRDARKQATRTRVLNAARELFEEVGCEAATIRAIAQRAGVATGSVFTTLPSKSAILRAVMQERLDDLSSELERVLPYLRGSCCDKVRSIMAVHYNFEMRWPRLYTTYVALGLEWEAQGSDGIFGANPKFRGIIADTLRDGIKAGEVRPDLDIELFLDVMLASYGFNYRYAGTEDAQALTARMDRQIGLLFEGAQADRLRAVGGRSDQAGAQQHHASQSDVA